MVLEIILTNIKVFGNLLFNQSKKKSRLLSTIKHHNVDISHHTLKCQLN